MGLYEQWKNMAETGGDQARRNAFWEEYIEKEKEVYQHILRSHVGRLEGRANELAARLGMEPAVFAGFLDGINTSLESAVDLDTLEADTEISAVINFEKLYRNMHEAKADWLYTLEEWDGVLSDDKRKEITKEFRRSKMAVSSKVGRNDPCPCGSGKKYKKCCGV